MKTTWERFFFHWDILSRSKQSIISAIRIFWTDWYHNEGCNVRYHQGHVQPHAYLIETIKNQLTEEICKKWEGVCLLLSNHSGGFEMLWWQDIEGGNAVFVLRQGYAWQHGQPYYNSTGKIKIRSLLKFQVKTVKTFSPSSIMACCCSENGLFTATSSFGLGPDISTDMLMAAMSRLT